MRINSTLSVSSSVGQRRGIVGIINRAPSWSTQVLFGCLLAQNVFAQLPEDDWNTCGDKTTPDQLFIAAPVKMSQATGSQRNWRQRENNPAGDLGPEVIRQYGWKTTLKQT
jgi:hypothetical protein